MKKFSIKKIFNEMQENVLYVSSTHLANKLRKNYKDNTHIMSELNRIECTFDIGLMSTRELHRRINRLFC